MPRPLPTSSVSCNSRPRAAQSTFIRAGRSASPFAGCGSRSITPSSGPPRRSLATRASWAGRILAAVPPRHRHRLAAAMGGESLQNMRRPPQDWFFAKRWAYQLGYGLATLLFNVFPLPQLSGFRESFRFAGESVDRGYSVLVFPEGEVNNSEHGHMAPFQSGIGLLAENLHIPVIPIRLDGVWQMKREHRRLAHIGEITVRIGAPVTFAHGISPEEIALRLESLIQSL